MKQVDETHVKHAMKIGPTLEAKLNKIYKPDTRVESTLGRLDITMITNENGEAVTAFVGKRNEDGSISGDRYTRKIVREPGSNKIIKSHWDYKGRVSRYA